MEETASSSSYVGDQVHEASSAEDNLDDEEDGEEEEEEEEEEVEPLSRAQAQANIDSQIDEMGRARALQAEKKLQFLLQQNDIFKHFGLDASKGEAKAAKKKGGRMTEKDGDSELLAADSDKVDTVLLKQPSIIVGEMRAYQLEGLNWLIRNHENGINGILADEMGLGKTLQSISILAYLKEFEHCNGPHLILVPKSTMANWMREIGRWCPSMRAVCFHGSKDERAAMVADVLRPGQDDKNRGWDVCVTTYEVCVREGAALQKFAWRYLIIDEAHRIKNENATFSKAVRKLPTQERLLITGTPLQNNLHELWALLNFLLPDIFSDSEQFDNWFDLEVDDREAKARMIGQLHKLLRPFMLRRLKMDVETSMPPKIETILYIGMSQMQKQLYKDLLSRNKDAVLGKYGDSGGSGGGGGNRTAILNIVMQLRKCCNHPYLFQGLEDRSLDPHGAHLVENCGKLVLLEKLLVRLKANGHRVLIFSQMTRMLDVLDDYLVSKQWAYCRIDGSTSYDARSDLIDAFNAPNSEKFVFLLSTRAGGLGINLQTADTVVLFDSDWNPQADLQAQDRAHRIGQKKQVHVYRLVTENSIEEKVVERAQQKLKLDAMVVQSGRLSEASKKLSKEDMLAAVKFGADHVFRTNNESSITDEDIDVLIQRGQKRTEALLETVDKGDAYDFSFKSDGGGFTAQTFEGVDYADPKARQRAIDEQLMSLMTADELSKHELGDRYHRRMQHEGDNAEGAGASASGSHGFGFAPRVKLPKHMRLPKMEDWQFFDTKRLWELCEVEEGLYVKYKANKGTAAGQQQQQQQQQLTQLPLVDVADAADTAASSSSSSSSEKRGVGRPPLNPSLQSGGSSGGGCLPLQVLGNDLQAEKEQLLREGCSSWSRAHYQNFVKASSKHGRSDYVHIAQEVGKTSAEVERYALLFWRKAPFALPPTEFENVSKRVEKGERKLGEIQRLSKATASFLGLWQHPLTQLTFRYVVGCPSGFVFGQDEDRHLLVATNKHGYGSWGAVRAEVRSSELFRFDFYLRSLCADEIGKRCETLMQHAAKELGEIERRQGACEELRRRLIQDAVFFNTASMPGSFGSLEGGGGDSEGGGGLGGEYPSSAGASSAGPASGPSHKVWCQAGTRVRHAKTGKLGTVQELRGPWVQIAFDNLSSTSSFDGLSASKEVTSLSCRVADLHPVDDRGAKLFQEAHSNLPAGAVAVAMTEAECTCAAELRARLFLERQVEVEKERSERLARELETEQAEAAAGGGGGGFGMSLASGLWSSEATGDGQDNGGGGDGSGRVFSPFSSSSSGGGGGRKSLGDGGGGGGGGGPSSRWVPSSHVQAVVGAVSKASAAAEAEAERRGTESGGTDGSGSLTSGGGVVVRDSGRFVLRPVSEEQLPVLLAVVFEMHLDARERVLTEFLRVFPKVSKRQVEIKLQEVAVKERRDSVRSWCLKPEFEVRYQAIKAGLNLSSASAAATASSSAVPPLMASPFEVSEGNSASPRSASSEPNKIQKKKPKQDPSPAVAASFSSVQPPATSSLSPSPALGGGALQPHAPYTAKALFRKAHLAGVRATLGPQHQGNKAKLKEALDAMWDDLVDKLAWEEKAKEDVVRHASELAEFEAATASAHGPSSSFSASSSAAASSEEAALQNKRGRNGGADGGPGEGATAGGAAPFAAGDSGIPKKKKT